MIGQNLTPGGGAEGLGFISESVTLEELFRYLCSSRLP